MNLSLIHLHILELIDFVIIFDSVDDWLFWLCFRCCPLRISGLDWYFDLFFELIFLQTCFFAFKTKFATNRQYFEKTYLNHLLLVLSLLKTFLMSHRDSFASAKMCEHQNLAFSFDFPINFSWRTVNTGQLKSWIFCLEVPLVNSNWWQSHNFNSAFKLEPIQELFSQSRDLDTGCFGCKFWW